MRGIRKKSLYASVLLWFSEGEQFLFGSLGWQDDFNMAGGR